MIFSFLSSKLDFNPQPSSAGPSQRMLPSRSIRPRNASGPRNANGASHILPFSSLFLTSLTFFELLLHLPKL